MPRLHLADAATLAILCIVTGTLALAVLRGAPLAGALALHAGLLACTAALALLLARRADAGWAGTLRGVLVIGVMFTLYSTLGHVAFEAVPWQADAALDAADRLLAGGAAPALLAERWAAPRAVEALSFFYAAFIPYLYMSIFLGLIGRPDGERDAFVTAFALLYAASFLGYLFLPARGPVVELAAEFGAPLAGGFFHDVVVQSIERMGGPHGAFPSLHIGASLLACRFDFRHGNPLRGLIYVPLVLLIAVATVVLRYHYVIDLVAGALLAILAGELAERWARRADLRLRRAPPAAAAAPAGAAGSAGVTAGGAP